ncbi:hypothetical protein C9F11_20975 [Streptomyces sp. YIM 121038]|uniref:DUF6409 family protein n=1 Tax=Streptomyces sp. YIM 121038 TaxID=2136401 RepID=UPI001110517D|nr:DUF6409 family protein [Streptomyces sp. YIM 121038]QCX77827.1 hypothetical protein C9F11_20975 [Streptomyces sp. YIM 121038]
MTTATQTTKPTVQDFPTATLVLAGPWFQGHQLDARPAIVVGPFGEPETTTTVLVWYFTIGAPEPGDSVQAMFPNELVPLDDTLTTMHAGTFKDLMVSLRRGRFAYDHGDALRAAVLQAWRERAGLADAAPETGYTLHRS